MHYTSECHYGTVRSLRRGRDGSVVLDIGEDDSGYPRLVVATDDGAEMCRPFLIGKRIGVFCRPLATGAYLTRYGFTALATVEGLSPWEEDVLWGWRRPAYETLCDGGFVVSDYEEDFLYGMAARGRPPTPKQVRFLESLLDRRRDQRCEPSRETAQRAARYRPRRRRAQPVAVGELTRRLFR